MSAREPVEIQGGLRASFSLLRRNRDFRRLYVASLISLGGDWFLLVALFGLVIHFTDSAIAVALVIAVEDLMYFLLSPLAGVLADRIDRRRLMVGADLARAVVCLGFLLIRTDSLVWLAFVLLAVMASFSAAFEPASQAALPNLVEEEDLATANALSGSLWGTMLAVGAALGGIVAAVFGRDTAFIVDAVSFLASAWLIWRIRRPFAEQRKGEDHAGVGEATVETIQYARRDHRVLALLAVKFGWGIAGGVLVLIPLLAHREYHAGDVGIGLLMASRGVGALIGPFVGRSALGPQDRRIFGAIALALAVFGLGYALLGLVPGLLLAMPTVALAHVGGGAQWTLSSYGLQRIVPDRIRGRIFAFDGMLVTLTFGLSSLLTGWLAESFGPRVTAVGMGGVAMGWAVVWSLLTTDVRRATLLEGCGTATAEREAA
ncbi:MAG TPA: MFS transporter [Actinomycetota bacterium]|nr:MFS transporter [Actinomycetota bacterium]